VSRELIFTSAPRGVRPGSQGFCTVAHTHGMPASLIQQLESLSGYRHLFSPQDPKASLNPVVFSHLTLAVAGRRCHVLSRICDAGLDYTQRTNKFAHHVVLDAAEVPSAGPAWLLTQPGFMQNKWAGEPSILTTGPVVPSGESKPRVCRAWQQLTGDAGWAGVLAETAAGPSSRQAVLVFQPGMDMLPLLAESLALLPAELRWRVSFSTYFTKLPAGITCQWRCVIDGAPEAVAARRAPQAALVIDLCRPLGRAAGGAYVESARTGKEPAITTTAEQLSDTELEYAFQDNDPPPIPAGVVLPASLGANVAGYNMAPPPVSSQWQRPPRAQLLNPKRKPRRRWPWVLATAAVLLIFLAGGLALWFASTDVRKDLLANAPPIHVADAPEKQNTPPKGKRNPDGGKGRLLPGVSTALREAIARDKSFLTIKTTNAALFAKASGTESLADKIVYYSKKALLLGRTIALYVKNKIDAENKVAGEKKLADTPLAIPAAKLANAKRPTICPSVDLPDSSTGPFVDQEFKPKIILSGDWSATASLALIGWDKAFGDSTSCELRRQKDGASEWRCWLTRAAVGESKIEDQIATFHSGKEGLRFSWLSVTLPGTIDRDQLRNCLLLFVKDGQEGVIPLRCPQRIKPIVIKFAKPPEYTVLKMRWLPKEAALAMFLDIDTRTSSKVVEKQRLSPTSFSAIIDKKVKIVVKWEQSKDRIAVSCSSSDHKELQAEVTAERVKRLSDYLNKEKTQRQKKLDAAEQGIPRLALTSREHDEASQHIKDLRQEINDISSRLTKLNRLDDLCREIKGEFHLRPRIVMTVRGRNGEEYQVVLVESDPPQQPAQ